MAGRKPGWDSQAIRDIANERYGGLTGLFEAMEWPERGAAMMPAQMCRVAETYGSVETFFEAHKVDPWAPAEAIWDQGYSVFWKSFWGWSPETWGAVGFTQSGRRDTIVRESTDPFICAIYVTLNADVEDVSLLGKVAGFYLISHQKGLRNSFTDRTDFDLEPTKWQYSLRATRAFTFLPEFRPDPYNLDPDLITRVRSVGSHGQFPAESVIDGLKSAPYREVPVFRGLTVSNPDIIVPRNSDAKKKTGVRGGTVNRSGYTVPGEPSDTPKELYVLRLEDNVSAFLPDKAPVGTHIFKIGLSMSPASRMAAFNAALPGDRFQWVIHRTTLQDGHDAYPSFEAALAGEDEMKRVLGASGGWMGGEFYSASPALLDEAWRNGRATALSVADKG